IPDFHVTGVQTCALPIWEFGSFSEALDEFFSSEETDAEEAKPKTALERRREMQERSIQEFREREQELARLGEKIYERYGEVEARSEERRGGKICGARIEQ